MSNAPKAEKPVERMRSCPPGEWSQAALAAHDGRLGMLIVSTEALALRDKRGGRLQQGTRHWALARPPRPQTRPRSDNSIQSACNPKSQKYSHQVGSKLTNYLTQLFDPNLPALAIQIFTPSRSKFSARLHSPTHQPNEADPPLGQNSLFWIITILIINTSIPIKNI